MKAIKHLILALSVIGVASAYADATRVFHDAQGRPLEATFIKLEGEALGSDGGAGLRGKNVASLPSGCAYWIAPHRLELSF